MRARMFMAGLLALPLGPGAVMAEEFSAAQRAEVVQILRESLKQDPGILRDALGALQADEAAQRQAATKAAITQQRSALVAPDDPVAGNPAGDVTIVEFFDVRCPYCRRLEPTVAQLLNEDHGVRLVYKDLPILGPSSLLGGRALLASLQQSSVAGGYEKLRTALMRPGPELTKEAIRVEVGKAGLDWTRLSADMDGPAVQQRIDTNLALARSLNIQGTPALVIGDTLIPGAVELADLRQTVATIRAGNK